MPNNVDDPRPNTVWGYHLRRTRVVDESRIRQPFGPQRVGFGVLDLLEELPLAAHHVLLSVLQVVYRAHLEIYGCKQLETGILIATSGQIA